MLQNAERRRSGLTLLDITFTLGLLGVLGGLMASAVLESQRAVLDSELVSELRGRAQQALDRLTVVVRRATTNDLQYSALQPEFGGGFHALRFQEAESIDATTGFASYSPDLVFVYGGDPLAAVPCGGLIIGRGSSLGDISSAAAGADGILGTEDDRSDLFTTAGNPRVEILIPDRFTPQLGDIFVLDVAPAPSGRLVTFTLRLNVQTRDGEFLLPNDLVVTQRVALRQ